MEFLKENTMTILVICNVITLWLAINCHNKLKIQQSLNEINMQHFALLRCETFKNALFHKEINTHDFIEGILKYCPTIGESNASFVFIYEGLITPEQFNQYCEINNCEFLMNPYKDLFKFKESCKYGRKA